MNYLTIKKDQNSAPTTRCINSTGSSVGSGVCAIVSLATDQINCGVIRGPLSLMFSCHHYKQLRSHFSMKSFP